MNLRPRKSDWLWDAAFNLVGGVILIAVAAWKLSALMFCGGLALLVLGVGYWFGQRWVRWAGLVIYSALAVCVVVFIVQRGFRIIDGVMLAVMAYAIWTSWTMSVDDERPMVSLVLLLREPRFLDSQVLRSMISQAWGEEIPEAEDEGEAAESFLVGDSTHFFVYVRESLFVVHNLEMPYFDEPEEVANQINELRTRKIVLEHRAWLAVDFMQADHSPEQLEEAYRRIGKLLAQLADGNCLGVFIPATSMLHPYDEELEQKLLSDNPLEALAQPVFPPVIEIADDDPRMLAAVAEARRRWPEFVGAFEARTPEQRFAVKAAFEEGDNKEFMWLSVSATEGDLIYGVLDNDPVELRKLACGDRVHVKVGELNDWIYSEGDEMKGGFTIKVLTGE